MAHYVDGFVIPVAKDRIEEYRRVAERASEVWKEHGALEYRECVGEDLGPVEGMVGFERMIDAKQGETVVFAWVVFASREARDEANRKIMGDPRMKELMDPSNQTFNYKRMAYGGFETLVYA